MQDIQTRLRLLKRPSLLVSAARFGLDDYRRDTHLPRILDLPSAPRSAAALVALLSVEAEMNAWRKENAGHYRPAHHVEVLIAIMGEAQLLLATTPSA